MEETDPKPVADAPPLKLFASHQQTANAQQQRDIWLAGQPLASLRISMPPFNKPPPGVQLPEISEVYDIPVFGLRITNAIMECFDLPGMTALASQLSISLPAYGLSKFIQKKMHKVRTLVDLARERDDCKSGANQAALGRLETFVDQFEKLKAEDIGGPKAWHAWVSERTVDDWMERQEFGKLLSNFGFEAQTAIEIQVTEIDDKQDDGSMRKVSLEQYSMRWLSKAFAGYNVVGCLTDVASLLFAMKGAPPSGVKPTEGEVVSGLKAVTTKLARLVSEKHVPLDSLDLWIPTHMFHDAETDDNLAWLLLKYVHKRISERGSDESNFQTLVQLPTANVKYPELETVAARFQKHDCEIFRDPSSRNADAIRLALDGGKKP